MVRYFPEPDLPPLVIEEALVEQIRSELPELPEKRCRRLMSEYSLPLYDSLVLASAHGAASFFEASLPLNRPWPLLCAEPTIGVTGSDKTGSGYAG